MMHLFSCAEKCARLGQSLAFKNSPQIYIPTGVMVYPTDIHNHLETFLCHIGKENSREDEVGMQVPIYSGAFGRL